MRSFLEKTVDLLYDNINLLIIDPFPASPRDPQGIHKAIWDEITDDPYDFYINVPLEATYMDTWNALPAMLRDLVL